MDRACFDERHMPVVQALLAGLHLGSGLSVRLFDAAGARLAAFGRMPDFLGGAAEGLWARNVCRPRSGEDAADVRLEICPHCEKAVVAGIGIDCLDRAPWLLVAGPFVTERSRMSWDGQDAARAERFFLSQLPVLPLDSVARLLVGQKRLMMGLVEKSYRRGRQHRGLRDVTRERELEQAQNMFIATAAHELRTPLTSILGYGEMLRDQDRIGGLSPVQQKEFLDVICDKAVTLKNIVGVLLDLSRVQLGRKLILRQEEHDINVLIYEVVAPFRQVAQALRFEIDLPPGALWMRFDQSKVGQVLDNLLGNAVKFSRSGGMVRVSGRKQGGVFQVMVEDQGVGMTRAQQARVFEKFYRADASNTALPGLGLGMSIARTIVEAHGGCIWVESESGQGTRVFFTLPLPGDKDS
jgi:signal transduction histidine kinase